MGRIFHGTVYPPVNGACGVSLCMDFEIVERYEEETVGGVLHETNNRKNQGHALCKLRSDD